MRRPSGRCANHTSSGLAGQYWPLPRRIAFDVLGDDKQGFGFPSRRPSDAGELAMDLVRHHADEPNPNGDRTTIGRKRLPRTAGKMEQPSCGTDRPGSCSDAIIPVGAGVGRPGPAAIARRRLSDRPCAMKERVLQRIPVLDARRRPIGISARAMRSKTC